MKREGDVGIIGLGLLGAAIAERLRDHGVRLVGYDIRDEVVRQQAAMGMLPAADASDVFARASTVIICLPNSDVVISTLKAVFEDARADQHEHPARQRIVIDTTTGAPDQMRACEQLLYPYGVAFVEACVAGSSDYVRRGEAKLLVGGAKEAVASVRPVLDRLASTTFVCGGVGAGARMKLVHNLVLGLNRAVLAEGLAFADGMGLDLASVLEVLQQTPAASDAMRSKGDKMVHRSYAPQAKLSQHRKDVRLILQEAEACDCPLRFSRLHNELLGEAEAMGLGEADNSAIFEVLSQIRHGEA